MWPYFGQIELVEMNEVRQSLAVPLEREWFAKTDAAPDEQRLRVRFRFAIRFDISAFLFIIVRNLKFSVSIILSSNYLNTNFCEILKRLLSCWCNLEKI